MMELINLDEVDSTNSWIERNAESLPSPVMVIARKQTAGRGQRGNSWESEPGKNLTFSVLYRPSDFPAILQFHLSEAVALAVVDFLGEHGIEAKVKWPNDIYVGDKKICGILIKHSLSGADIGYSIIGVGINVNQKEFLSDAPNPVSMTNLTEAEYDLEVLAHEMGEILERRIGQVADSGNHPDLHEEFRRRLWRGDGRMYPFRVAKSGELFEASVSGIRENGILGLGLSDGSLREFAFKEVEWILE